MYDRFSQKLLPHDFSSICQAKMLTVVKRSFAIKRNHPFNLSNGMFSLKAFNRAKGGRVIFPLAKKSGRDCSSASRFFVSHMPIRIFNFAMRFIATAEVRRGNVNWDLTFH